MSRQKTRGRPSTAPASPFDQARDEMFQHVMRCGVIGSEPEHQREWFDETMQYLAERYHELSKKEVSDLRVLGERFAAPAKKPDAVESPGVDLATEDDAASEADVSQLDAVNAA